MAFLQLLYCMFYLLLGEWVKCLCAERVLTCARLPFSFFFSSTEMNDCVLMSNCRCVSMCVSVVKYGGHRGVGSLSPLKCICIWNSKVTANVFLSVRVPEEGREISLLYFTCQTLKKDRWGPISNVWGLLGLPRSQLPIHNHRHISPKEYRGAGPGTNTILSGIKRIVQSVSSGGQYDIGWLLW